MFVFLWFQKRAQPKSFYISKVGKLPSPSPYCARPLPTPGAPPDYLSLSAIYEMCTFYKTCKMYNLQLLHFCNFCNFCRQ